MGSCGCIGAAHKVESVCVCVHAAAEGLMWAKVLGGVGVGGGFRILLVSDCARLLVWCGWFCEAGCVEQPQHLCGIAVHVDTHHLDCLLTGGCLSVCTSAGGEALGGCIPGVRARHQPVQVPTRGRHLGSIPQKLRGPVSRQQCLGPVQSLGRVVVKQHAAQLPVSLTAQHFDLGPNRC